VGGGENKGDKSNSFWNRKKKMNNMKFSGKHGKGAEARKRERSKEFQKESNGSFSRLFRSHGTPEEKAEIR